MKRFAANYIFPITSKPIKNGIIETDDNGKIVDIIDTKGSFKEISGLEFYNGILVPGFVNTHCHLELSHLKNKIPEKTGLKKFIASIRKFRNDENTTAIKNADNQMLKNGIVACGDISNTDKSFDIKHSSKIFYHTFIEIFGLDAEKNNDIITKAKNLSKKLEKLNLQNSIVPHSTYSLNNNLFNELKKINNNTIQTIHNQESFSENDIFKNNTGELYSFFKTFSKYKFAKTNKSSIQSVGDFLNKNNRTLFVHNTFSNYDDIEYITSNFKDSYFCFCPSSNLYIENKLPDFNIFEQQKNKITIGTDSLASNKNLDLLNELKILSKNSNFLLDELLQFATLNGAKFLGLEHKLGSFEKNKTPGINLITDIDFRNMKISDKSKIVKLN